MTEPESTASQELSITLAAHADAMSGDPAAQMAVRAAAIEALSVPEGTARDALDGLVSSNVIHRHYALRGLTAAELIEKLIDGE